MQRNLGFTLIELLVVLAVFGLLSAVALSTFQDAVAASHSAAARSALSESLLGAFNRSFISGTKVVVCASTDGTTCSGGMDWSTGWIAFTDSNENRERDPDDLLVGSHPPLTNGIHMRSSVGRTRIVFQPHGGVNAGSNVTFTFCDQRGPAKASALILANSGRLRAATASVAQGLACLDAGT